MLKIENASGKYFIYHSSIIDAQIRNSKYFIIPSCAQKEIKLLIPDFKYYYRRLSDSANAHVVTLWINEFF